jgi:hypothetical protein
LRRVHGGEKHNGRPPTPCARPEVASLLGRIFDLDALAALAPAQGGDMNWLMDWTDAANATHG